MLIPSFFILLLSVLGFIFNNSAAPPEHFLAILNPLTETTLPASQFLGVSFKGNWLFIGVIVIFYPLAQVAEEFMWRGYILPRQEKSYGHYAWLVN